MPELKAVGLTGNMGCGKSTVAKIMRQAGFEVIDSDALAKTILFSPETDPKLKEIFGNGIFDGKKINIRKMAIAFFENESAKKRWEAWIFPRVLQLVKEEIRRVKERNHSAAIVVESALIYEIGWEKKFDCVIVVKCSEAEQHRRLLQNRGLSLLEIEERLVHQLPSAEKEKRADYVIDTECPLEELENRVNGLLKSIEVGLR